MVRVSSKTNLKNIEGNTKECLEYCYECDRTVYFLKKAWKISQQVSSTVCQSSKLHNLITREYKRIPGIMLREFHASLVGLESLSYLW